MIFLASLIKIWIGSIDLETKLKRLLIALIRFRFVAYDIQRDEQRLIKKALMQVVNVIFSFSACYCFQIPMDYQHYDVKLSSSYETTINRDRSHGSRRLPTR